MSKERNRQTHTSKDKRQRNQLCYLDNNKNSVNAVALAIIQREKKYVPILIF
jgi:hypothetical protein